MERTIEAPAGLLEVLVNAMQRLPQGNRLPSDVHLAVNLTKNRLSKAWRPYLETRNGLIREHLGEERRVIEPGDQQDPEVRAYLDEWSPVANETVEVIVDVIPWDRLMAKYDEEAMKDGGGPDLPDGFQQLLDLGIVLRPDQDPRLARDLPDDFPGRDELLEAGIRGYDHLRDRLEHGLPLTEIEGIGKATAEKVTARYEDYVGGDEEEDEGDDG